MLENIIDFSMEVFSRLFKIDLNWCFATIDTNTPEELKKAISMAYNHEEKVIVINPFILEQYSDKNYTEDKLNYILFGLVAHEYRHAWQHHSEEYNKEWAKYNTYESIKKKYLFQKVEIDAYAFQEACIWIISDELNHHLSIPEEAANTIHKLAVEHYYQYRSQIKQILNELIKEFC